MSPVAKKSSVASTSSSSAAPSSASAPGGLGPSQYRQRFDNSLATMLALSTDDLLIVNVDLAALVLLIRGKLAAVLALRPELARLPHFNLALFDHLEDYTGALFYTQAMYVTDAPPEADLAPLAQRCAGHLDTLLVATTALLERGLLPKELLHSVGRTNAHDKLVLNTQALVERLRAAWPTIGTRTALTPEDLTAAETAATALGDALSARAAAEARTAEAAELRQRAFTLFVRAWDEARRGVTFLRWHEGDADQLAPSPYINRGPHRSPKKTEPSTDLPVASAKAPAEAPSTPAATLHALSGGAEPGQPFVAPAEDPFARG